MISVNSFFVSLNPFFVSLIGVFGFRIWKCIPERPFDVLGNAEISRTKIDCRKTIVFHIITQTDSLKKQGRFVRFAFVNVDTGLHNQTYAMYSVLIAKVCRDIKAFFLCDKLIIADSATRTQRMFDIKSSHHSSVYAENAIGTAFKWRFILLREPCNLVMSTRKHAPQINKTRIKSIGL